MRRFAVTIGASIIGAVLPLAIATAAQAEDVVIRIEAKRGNDAAQASAAGWAAQFPDVVTFPLADGWVGIALGPMPRETATTRLTQLKQDRKVPGDSFLSAAAGRALSTLSGTAPEVATEAAPAAGAGSPSTFPAATLPETAEATAQPDAQPEVQAEVQPEVQPEVQAPPPPLYYLRLESHPDRSKAEQVLAEWRKTLPESGLWTLPGGRSAIAFGPMEEATGKAWLAAFRAAGAVPKDAFLSPAADMGESAIPGEAPDLGAPPAPDATPVAMPSLEDIQRALRWAGHYDGSIDGKDGPKTRAAIAGEIVRLRASPDTATAMAELIHRRAAWRDQMGLITLRDTHTGLALPAPMQKLQFDRADRALSIYGPKDGSGAALILFSQPGGQQEMLDLAGLVTALGWVPAPERQVERGSVILDGRNQTHIGHAEGRVVDGRVQGFVLIWPISDPEDQHRLAAEISDNLTRFAPGEAEGQDTPAIPPAEVSAPTQD